MKAIVAQNGLAIPQLPRIGDIPQWMWPWLNEAAAEVSRVRQENEELREENRALQRALQKYTKQKRKSPSSK